MHAVLKSPKNVTVSRDKTFKKVSLTSTKLPQAVFILTTYYMSGIKTAVTKHLRLYSDVNTYIDISSVVSIFTVWIDSSIVQCPVS